MSKENPIACIVFSTIVLLSFPFLAGAETLTNDSIVKMQMGGLSEAVIVAKIKNSQNSFDLSTDKIVSLKKTGVSDKVIEAMIHTQSQVGNASQPPQGIPFDPNYYNPGQMSQAGGQSQLRGQQGIDDGTYTGMSGQAQQSYENCQQRLQRIFLPQNPNGRSVSFWLEAKNEQTAQYGFTGPGAACVPVTHKKMANTIYGYFLVIYRGGLELEFPDFKKMLQGKIGADTPSQNLGDVGSWDSILLQNVWVQHLTITDPAPSMVIQNNRK